jgi:rhodanese-related sulfurtransferase
MKRFRLVPVLVLTVFMVACGGAATVTPSTTSVSTIVSGTPVAVSGGTYLSITPAQLYSMLTQPATNFFLVDADTEYVGEISGTSLFINSDNVTQEMNEFPTDKTTAIVLYCTAGVHSAQVAAILVQAGYTNVMDLSGGIVAWQQQGYMIVNDTRTMT